MIIIKTIVFLFMGWLIVDVTLYKMGIFKRHRPWLFFMVYAALVIYFVASELGVQ